MKSKPGTPSSLPTKSLIFNWIKQIVPDSQIKFKVEDLGTGVLYCRIINHYFPNSINLHRLNNNPKNQYEYIQNLKLLQNALTLHKVNIPFDFNKIAQLKFLQNWALINALYKYLASDEVSNQNDEIRSVSVSCSQINKFTPKKSFQMAFPNDNNDKKIFESQNNQNITKMTTFQPVNSMSIGQLTNNYQHIQTTMLSNPMHHPLQPKQNLPNSASMNSYNMAHNLYLPIQPSYNNYSALLNSNTNLGNFNFGTLNALNLQRQPLSLKQSISNNYNNLQNQPKLHLQQGKCWSVGKLPSSRQASSLSILSSSYQQGKYSVNSHIIQNNYNAIIDRVKEILLKASHDIEKIRQIKMLFNIPLNEETVVKVEEEDSIKIINLMNKDQDKNIDNKVVDKENIKDKETEKIDKISSKETIQTESKQNIQEPAKKPLLQISAKKQLLKQKIPQSSGKKIKNNFFGEGIVFRK